MEQQNIEVKDARIKLIDTATKLFAERGFAAVSIREVADAAEVNSSMISYYFGGKENLYAAVLKAQLEKVRKRLSVMIDNRLPPLERLLHYANGIYEAHHESPYLARFMTSEMTNPTNVFETIIRPFISTIFTMLYQAIEEGKQHGQIKPGIDAANATIALAAIINFYFIARPITEGFLPQDSLNHKNYAMQAIEIYLNGVKANG